MLLSRLLSWRRVFTIAFCYVGVPISSCIITLTYILYHIKPNLHRAHDKKREMHQVLGGADIGPEPDDFFGLTVAAPQ
jgi:hypothetical protein